MALEAAVRFTRQSEEVDHDEGFPDVQAMDFIGDGVEGWGLIISGKSHCSGQ